jgi:hypothetical protein
MIDKGDWSHARCGVNGRTAVRTVGLGPGHLVGDTMVLVCIGL